MRFILTIHYGTSSDMYLFLLIKYRQFFQKLCYFISCYIIFIHLIAIYPPILDITKVLIKFSRHILYICCHNVEKRYNLSLILADSAA